MQNLDPVIVLFVFVGFFVAIMIKISTTSERKDNLDYVKMQAIKPQIDYRSALMDTRIEFFEAMISWFLWWPSLVANGYIIRKYFTAEKIFVALGAVLPSACLLTPFGSAATDWVILAGLAEYLLVGLLAHYMIKRKDQHGIFW
jgi:hypothetical protein